MILGRNRSDILGAMGVALLQTKNEHRLTLEDIGETIGRTRESVSQYIAGDAEMGAVAWLRATAAWPEIVDRLNASLNGGAK